MSSHSLLWMFSKPGYHPSWLFGTMHIRDERAHQMCNHLYPCIDQADAFIGEMNLEIPLDAPEPIVYNARGHFSTNTYRKLQHQLLKSFNIDLNNFSHLHPMMVMGVISNSVLEAEHLISLDERLWNYAKEKGKILSGLESFDEQFRILHSIDPQPLYKELKDIGRNPSGVRWNTTRGLDLYVHGRIHALYKLSKSSMHDLRKKIIYERNAKMTNVILQLDNTKQYFITVGAGHLSGKNGILSKLRKNGYKVVPVRNSIR